MDSSKKGSKKKIVVLSKILGQNWFPKYLELRNTQDDLLYMDILKELYDERLDDVHVLHLLSLIEQRFTFLEDTDRLEQLIGSLLNVYNDSNKRPEVKRKYLYTITTLFVCDVDLIDKDATLLDHLNNFVTMLSMSLNSECKITCDTATDCLQQIESALPGTLEKHVQFEAVKDRNFLIAAQLLSHGSTFTKDELDTFFESLSTVKNLAQFHHCLSYLLYALKHSQSQQLLSALIFKPYISELTLTPEIYNFHLALQLFQSYGLELFSSREEQELIGQLRKLATHPNVSISERLLSLDFWKSLIPSIKRTNSSHSLEIEISPKDGPDTQEKKLSILCESAITNDDLILKLKPIEDLSLSGRNPRATNAFYRILHQCYSCRPSMQSQVECLLIAMIVTSPCDHIGRCIDFLEKHPSLVVTVCLPAIRKFLESFERPWTEKDLSEYFSLIEWTIRQTPLSDEFLVRIFTFLFEKCKSIPQLVESMLQCCAAVIRSHVVGGQVKAVLNEIFQYLSQHCKNDISILSWSQIYTIALNTLTSDSDLKSVFQGDELLRNSSENPLLEYHSDACPIIIEYLPCKSYDVDFWSLPYKMKFKVKLSINPRASSNLHSLYVVVVNLDCNSQGIQEEQTVPVLTVDTPQTLKFYFTCKDVQPFWINISILFGDSEGVTHVYQNLLRQYFTFQNKLLRTQETDFNKLWLHIRAQNPIESCFVLSDLHTIDEFYLKHSWLCPFVVKNETDICCLACPSKVLLMKVKLINGVVNLKILCNDYEMFETSFNEFITAES